MGIVKHGSLSITSSTVRGRNMQIIYNTFETPSVGWTLDTGHWTLWVPWTLQRGWAVKEYCGVAAIISLQRPVLQSILRNQECSVCVLYCVWVWVCVACDRTKMPGYHALMCMPNPLVLSHNLRVWLRRFGSTSRGLRRAAAQEAGHDPS